MAVFEYQAVTSAGKNRKGILEADHAKQARAILQEKKLIPYELVELPTKKNKVAVSKGLFDFSQRLTAAELSLVTRQFATLLSAGLPLEEALLIVSNQSEKVKIKRMISQVRSRVLEGERFSDALSEYPAVFSSLYCATVAAGEKTGCLGGVLERLADYVESRQVLRDKIGLALLYPMMISIVALAVIISLLVYVVPQIIQVFDSIDQQLPPLTKGLIVVSEFIQQNGVYLLLAGIFIVVLFKISIRNIDVKKKYHFFLLKIPLISILIKGIDTARFTRTLGVLFGSGVPVLESLKISSNVINNLPIKSVVESAVKQVSEGVPIYKSLDQGKIFPPMVIHLIASGEKSGRLDQMLERVSIQQEEELKSILAKFVGVFEPLMILLMGGIVLIIVLAIMLPIFDLNQLVK